ncbi:MAG: hypothetical protein JNK61_02785 [Bacteroidia bacterium]|nr:hypothetical protein [Bacteroidia bacterium]HQV01532.1 hypothetical protein [Bacteroidia bacterium]
MMLFYFKWLPVGGIVLFPFVLMHVSQKHNAITLNHERIHYRQQLEMCILPFYICYVLHYFYNLIRYRKHQMAYTQICFEREAYANQTNQRYLEQRKFFAWYKYI